MNGHIVMESKASNGQEISKGKVNKRLFEILENKEKFESAVKEGEKILPQRNSFSDKKSRNDPRNDVVVCTRIRSRTEKEKRESLMESFIARNPFTFAAEVSFTFKREASSNSIYE